MSWSVRFFPPLKWPQNLTFYQISCLKDFCPEKSLFSGLLCIMLKHLLCILPTTVLEYLSNTILILLQSVFRHINSCWEYQSISDNISTAFKIINSIQVSWIQTALSQLTMVVLCGQIVLQLYNFSYWNYWIRVHSVHCPRVVSTTGLFQINIYWEEK